jgi:hypothetical protein
MGQEVSSRADGPEPLHASPEPATDQADPVIAALLARLILDFGVLDVVSGDQGADQRAEEGLASFTRVVDELKEPEIDWKFLLRNAAMRPQPGAQQ